MNVAPAISKRVALALLAAAPLFTLLGASDPQIIQKLFVGTTYYLLLATVLCWVGTHLYVARALDRAAILGWVKENWRGLLVALSVTVIAAVAIEPALRVLSDEANLVGTSKNLFTSKSPTFTLSGKNYYGSYWDIDVAIDQRPTLFPFLVSLVHAVLGYSFTNAFHFNLMLLPVFVLVAYRLAKSLGGETFGLVTALFVVAHPIFLISVRSGGFDVLAALFGLLVVKSFCDFARTQRPGELALLWTNLCMFAHVRYESVLFIVPVVLSLLVLQRISWSKLRPYALIYALTPALLLPRIWQSMLRGNIPKQPPGTDTLSFDNFVNNAKEYLLPILEPAGSFPAHSALLIALGILGCLTWTGSLVVRMKKKDFKAIQLKLTLFVAIWMLIQIAIVFTYVWGRAQYPSAARLVIPIDTFLSFAAAWLVTRVLARTSPFVPVMLAVAVLATQMPVAAQARIMNRLTQTRESAATWDFFERLGNERILIVTDRPHHFTIMNYGAMSFDSARRDAYLFTALDRRLFQDVYVIQQIQLSTNTSLSGYEFWSDRTLHTVHEFQNDADVLVRISRVSH